MKPVPTRRVRKILTGRGCLLVATEGSHEEWQTPGGLTDTIAARDREQGAGLLRNVVQMLSPEFGPKRLQKDRQR